MDDWPFGAIIPQLRFEGEDSITEDRKAGCDTYMIKNNSLLLADVNKNTIHGMP
jgi:hypothetical protein